MSLGSIVDQVDATGVKRAIFDVSALERLDSTGALILQKLRTRLEANDVSVEISGLSDGHRPLLGYAANLTKADALTELAHHPLLAMVERLGRGAVAACHEARNLTNFLGMTVVSAFRSLLNPGQIRFVSVISHIEKTGLNALPIVGLLSFLISVVLAFQGADQLTRFGADIFTVDLLGISIFREMGVLLTAIVVAGRSCSAFAAELGTMQVTGSRRDADDGARPSGYPGLAADVGTGYRHAFARGFCQYYGCRWRWSNSGFDPRHLCGEVR
jgi:phospholipid/cholesterol/gamma-HCH transport system permease protein